MLILTILVIGIAAGWVAQLILGGRQDWTEAAIAGIVGSFVGGLVGSLLAGDGFSVRPSGLIGSSLGAVIVLGLWRTIKARA